MKKSSDVDITLPDNFSTAVRTHPKYPEKPFKFKDREFWIPIYREFSPATIEKTLIILGSRKFDKTEFVLNMILYALYGFTSWNVLYTIARRKQVRVFSVKRLVPSINTSVNGCLKERFISSKSGIHNREFKTDNPNVINTLTLESSWNMAEGVLGEEAQFIIGDEFQDQVIGTFPKLKEMETQSPRKWMIICGTARDALDELTKQYKASTQNIWVVTCKHCGKDQVFGEKVNRTGMGVRNIFKTIECDECGTTRLLQGWRCAEIIQCSCGKSFGKEHMTTAYKGCAFCKQKIDPRDGHWRPFNEGAIYVGYRANQVMHPAVSAVDIYKKMIDYPFVQFVNEVLGEFYGGEGRPIPMSDVLACRAVNLNYLSSSDAGNNMMGIDPGKVNYCTITDNDHNRILYQEAREFGSMEEKKNHYLSLVKAFNVGQTVIDFGYGGDELAKEMRPELGDKVKTCRYTSSKSWYNYVEKDKIGNRIYRMEIDKVTACEEIIRRFNNHVYKIPYGHKSIELAETTFDHYVNIIRERPKEEEVKASTTIEKTKIGNAGDDHYFHTLVYCYLAGVKRKRSINIKIVGNKIGRKRRIEKDYYEKLRNSAESL